MRIGPLVSQSSLVPFVAGFITALDFAGVIRCQQQEVQRLYPQQASVSSGIQYGATDALHVPLLRVDLGRTCAREEYEEVSQSPAPESAPFLRDAGQIDAIFGRSLAEVADVLERPEVLGGCMELQVPEMAERLRFLGKVELGALLRQCLGIEDLGMRRLPIHARVLQDAAQIVEFIAQTDGTQPAPISDADSGAYAFISGLLSAGMGTEEGKQRASASFLWSATHYLRGGSPVAAAIAAETAGFLLDSIRDQAERDAEEGSAEVLDLEVAQRNDRLETEVEEEEEAHEGVVDEGNQGFLKAAFYWKLAAEKLRDEGDDAGFWIALSRGIIAAEASFSASAKPLKIALHELAARAQHRPEYREREGQEWLRAAEAEMSDFEGSPASWGTIGKLLQRAIDAYREAGDSGPLLGLLEDLERRTEEEGRTHFNDLKLLDLAIEERPEDLQLLHERAMLRLKHGHFNGALDDLERLNGLDEGNPWLVSDLALICHHFAHLYSIQGDIDSANEMLAGAYYYIDAAMQLARRNDLELGLLYARRGALRATAGKVVQAIADLEKAIALSPRDPEIREYLSAVKRNRAILTR